MPNRSVQLEFTGNKGRFGTGRPLDIPDGGCLEAVNVEWYQSALGRKRGATSAFSMTSGPTTKLGRLFRHMPSSDETAAQLWAIEEGAFGSTGTNNVKRYASSAWGTPSTEDGADDNITQWQKATACSFNGKLFITGADTGVKVYDGTVLRRAGIAAPAAAPTVANTGSGSYAATARYYKVAFVQIASSVVTRRSELSPASTVFTPSGSGLAARVTKPTTTLGAPTHWEVYGSPDGVDYYLLTPAATAIAVATSTWDDTGAPGSYSGAQPPVVGDNTVPPNMKAIALDGNRLIGWGSYSTSEKQSRFWYTPVLGSSYIGDDERVPLNNYRDIGENDGDYATALSDNVDGVIYAFKRRHIYRVTPTGDLANPYTVSTLSNTVGAADATAIIQGEDAQGNACIYVVGDTGIYRVGIDGVRKIQRNVEDKWTTAIRPLYYLADRKQVFFVNHSANLYALVFHVETEAWSLYTGAVFPRAVCAAPWASSLAGGFWKMYLGWNNVTDTPKISAFNHDTGAGADEGATQYESYILTAPRAPFGLLRNVEAQDPTVVAQAYSSGGWSVASYGDWLATGRSCAMTTTPPAGSPSYIHLTADGVGVAGASVIYYRVGDSANSDSWSVDRLVVNVLEKEG